LNPDVAGLMVHLLQVAGVSAGDTVAVGASGSFPGLWLATLSAIRALDAHPLTILSLGSSSYGASRMRLHLLDLHLLLVGEGVLSSPPAAASVGGRRDVGSDLEPEVRRALRLEVTGAEIPFLDEPDLPTNVARRMAIYGNPDAFVNIGGAHANLGSSPLVLEVLPGLNTSVELPPPADRGVLFEMAARGIPVIHLLHIRGLALRHGLAWDPIPLPDPGSTDLRSAEPSKGWKVWALTGGYLTVLLLLAISQIRANRRRG
jgi:poly-gamma-glutamate system protein